jgi:hypothetical protein
MTVGASFGSVAISYCDFQYGDTSASYPDIIAVYGAETSVSVDHCTFDAGYRAISCLTALSATTNFSIQTSKFTAMSNTYLGVRSGSTATGTRSIYGNTFGGGIISNAGGWLNFTIDSNVFNATAATGTASVPIVTGALGNWSSLQNNLLRFPTVGSSMSQQGPISNNLIICDDSTNHDPNLIQILQTISGTGTVGAFSGNVAQIYTTTGNSAIYYCATGFNPTSSTVIQVLNNVTLANISGTNVASGSIFNCTKMNSFTSVTLDHNTTHIGGTIAGAFCIGDPSGTGVVSAGTIVSMRANLCYATATASGTRNGVVLYGETGVATDACAAANCDYNGGNYFLPSSGTNTPTGRAGYINLNGGSMFSSPSSAGVHDVSSTDNSKDPQFFDSTRDVATAFTSSGCLNQTSVGTKAQNFQQFTVYVSSQIQTDPTIISRVVTWIKSGFAPKNSLYNVTFSGDTNSVKNIGAIPFAHSALPIIDMFIRLRRADAALDHKWFDILDTRKRSLLKAA